MAGFARVSCARPGSGWLLAAILFTAVPMLAQNRLEDSQAAAARGDAEAAIEAADDASAMQPWASSLHLQLALLEEQQGNPRRGEPPCRRCARPRSLRLEHLAGCGARADQGWFHTQRAQEPAPGRAPEPQVPTLRGPPGPRVPVLRKLRVKQPHLRRARRLALLAAATLVTALEPRPTPARRSGRWRPRSRTSTTRPRTSTACERRGAHGEAGLSVARVAPDISPADFDPANPADPRYDWEVYDDQVRAGDRRACSR